MKNYCFNLIAIVLLPVVATAQALPNAPAPTLVSDTEWHRIQNLSDSVEIEVHLTSGHPVHCLFAGATETELFCDTLYASSGHAYPIDRARVLSVHTVAAEKNHHVGLITAAITVGVLVGLAASKNSTNQVGVMFGLLGAGAVGGLGLQMGTVQSQYRGGIAFQFQPRAIGRTPVRFPPRLPAPVLPGR